VTHQNSSVEYLISQRNECRSIGKNEISDVCYQAPSMIV